MSVADRTRAVRRDAGSSLGWAPLTLIAAALALVGGCVTRPEGPDTPTMRAIEDATGIIEYPSQRLVILKRIAKREDLAPHEQLYLVNAILMGGFSSDRADALLLLLRNSCCAEATRQHIRDRLKTTRLLGSDHRRVLEALALEPAKGPPEPG